MALDMSGLTAAVAAGAKALADINKEAANIAAQTGSQYPATSGPAILPPAALPKMSPVRVVDLNGPEPAALDAALKASFAAKYPDVGSHTTPGACYERDMLQFWPVETAQANAQAKFEEAAAVAGNDYIAFGGPTNHDTGSYAVFAVQNGQPMSDFYGPSNPIPVDPTFKPKDCGQGQQWNAVTSKCEPIPGFWTDAGTLQPPAEAKAAPKK